MTLILEGNKEEVEEFLNFLEENHIEDDVNWIFEKYDFEFKDKEYYRYNTVKQSIEIKYSEHAKVRSTVMNEIERREK